MIATCLKVAFAEKAAALIRTALNDVARVKGMTEVAAASKITRQALCAIYWGAGGEWQYDAGGFAGHVAWDWGAVVG